MAKEKWTRQSAIEFLTSNANFRELRANSSNAKPVHTMKTSTLTRYASRLQEAERAGEWLKDAAALRGHEISENKPKNKRRKPGHEDWEPPRTIDRGLFLRPDRHGRVTLRRVTGSQAEVVRFLARMARTKGPRPQRQIAVNIYGFRKGEYAQLLWRGGYNAASLLKKAGYYHNRRGRWVKIGRGIGPYLLDVLAATMRYPRGWDRIALYEVYAFAEPIHGASDAAINGRRERRIGSR